MKFKKAFDRHKISLKKHIDTLTQNYQGIKGLNTIDTVIMFCLMKQQLHHFLEKEEQLYLIMQ